MLPNIVLHLTKRPTPRAGVQPAVRRFAGEQSVGQISGECYDDDDSMGFSFDLCWGFGWLLRAHEAHAC
jgi:hypothetical protein